MAARRCSASEILTLVQGPCIVTLYHVLVYLYILELSVLQVHIEFSENKVILEGPPEEVEKAQQAIREKADDLVRRLIACAVYPTASAHDYFY